MLGGLTPNRAPQVKRLAIHPLARRLVVGPRSGGDGEIRYRGTGVGEAQLRVSGQVANSGDRDLVHGVLLVFR